MLKESEETLFHRPLKTTRAERLIVIKDGCDKVLTDLQSLVDKYESLGTQSKRTWDRMKWGNEDISEIRARLISSTTMLNAFIGTSESNVESKLDSFIREYRQGKREASIISLQTVDSLSGDDKALWQTIRKELEEIGISVAAFDANRTFIFDWLTRAAETGAFAEQGEPGIDDENNHSEEQASRSNDARVKEDAGQETRHTQYEPSTNTSEERPYALPHSLMATTVAEPHSPERGPKTSGEMVASPSILVRGSTRVPRIAAFLAVVSRPRRRLLRAVETGDFPKALKILSDENSLKRLDPETLGKTLLSTTLLDGLGSSDHLSLISELIAKGANVNHNNRDFSGQNPLWNSVASNSIAAVRLLLENGADVNCYSSKSALAHASNDQQDWFAPRQALTGDTEMLRLLLSAGADTQALYKAPLKNFASRPYSLESLLHEATRLGAITAIEVLIEHGAKIDLLSPYSGTALMVALLMGKRRAAELLIARGANVNFDDEIKFFYEYSYAEISRISYESPIEAAILGGHLSMVELLLKHGVVPTKETLYYVKWVMSRLPEQPRYPDYYNGHLREDGRERQDSEIADVVEKAFKKLPE